jgi:hypothetical protein
MWKKLAATALAAGVCYYWAFPGWIDLDSPLAHAVVFDADERILDKHPVQKSIEGGQLVFPFKDYRIQALASFEAKARVLSRKDYRRGRESDLSPIDLALGWGPMSREDIIRKIDISQNGRFYFWQVEEYPIPHNQIVTHSANMHLIPANRMIEQQLRDIDSGDMIRFRGYLVSIDASDGWRWKSSLTRKDSGAGACEIVLVEAIHEV